MLEDNFKDLAIQNRLHKTLPGVGLFTEDRVRRFSPRRANFYNEFLLTTRDPEGRNARELAYNIAAVNENRVLVKNERMNRVLNTLEYIKASGDNQLEKRAKDVVLKFIDDAGKEPLGDLKKENIKEQLGGAGTPPLKELLVDRKIAKEIEDLENTTTTDEVERKLAQLKHKRTFDPILSEENIKGSNSDVIIFIIFTYFLQVVALNMVEWMMTSGLVSHMSQAVFAYLVCYLLLFLLVVTTIGFSPAYVSNLLFLFSPRVPGGATRIIAHLIPYGFMFVLWSILKMRKIESTYSIMNLGDRKKMVRKLSKATFVLWIISSVIVFALK